MSLTDSEILELHDLCSALLDDQITDVQQQSLTQMLASSNEARAFYFHEMSLSASLTEYANDMQSDAPVMPAVKPKQSRAKLNLWTLGALSMAACLAFGSFLYFNATSHSSPTTRDELADGELQTGALIARVTGVKDPVWKAQGHFLPGDALSRGQRLELESGVAEITFDCGARLVLEGPAVLDVESAWEATLQHGGLKATVPHEAIGFRVHHSSVEVVDLGTEFSMVATAGGDAEVRVIEGSVEVSPVNAEEPSATVLHTNETRRFGKNRKTGNGDMEARHGRLAQSKVMDRGKLDVSYAHWSLDHASEGGFKAEVVGLAGVQNARFDAGHAGELLTDGRWQNALRFDGTMAMSAVVPGISRPVSRTVAFWVRVPENAELLDSHAMVAWQTHSKKMISRVLEIGWNRNPNQGPLGALRTDLGKIYAVGVTPLRDGRWHHLAIVFLPIASKEGAVQVTQYVDGRLEGTTLHAIKSKHLGAEMASSDVMWMGRLPGKRNKSNFFRGDMDELFITDRALSPTEIVRLMTENQPPRLELTDATTR